MSTPPAPRRSKRNQADRGRPTTQGAAAALGLDNAPLSTSTSATPAPAPPSTSPSPIRQHPAASIQHLPQDLPSLSQRLPFVIDWNDRTQEIRQGDKQAVAMASGHIPSSAAITSDTHSAHLSHWVFAPSSPTKAIDPMDYETTLKADEIRDKLKKALPTRWVKRYCIVRPDAKRDNLIKVIMASGNVLSAIQKVRKAASDSLFEKVLEQLVGELGNAFRSELLRMRRRPDTPYGKFASRGTKKVQTPSIGHDQNYRADLVVQEVNPTPAKDGEVQYDWGQLMSFVEVKRSGWQDGTDALAIQGTQYVRMLLAYRPLTSHVYFLTWCGEIARLWYVDAANAGHSRPVSLKRAKDRLEIGRFLCLLTSEECRGVLAGRWDPAKQVPVQAVLGSTTNPLNWDPQHLPKLLHNRSWPFGSRTAVWEGKTPEMVKDKDQSRRLFLKCSWVPKHRLGHEVKMQQCLEGVKGSPRPLGSAVIPSHVIEEGFKVETLQQPDPTARDGQTGLYLCAIVYEHRIGRMIDSEIPTSTLAYLHAQLVDTLLSYAQKGLHYRDLNAGNMLIQDGSDDELLLIDQGGMRELLRPRGEEWRGALTAIVKRAQDDARSANQMFLPSANHNANDEAQLWAENMEELEIAQQELQSGTPADLQAEMERLAISKLPRLRELLLSVIQLSHRYIDDLEGALYLHMWQVASMKKGVDPETRAKVEETRAKVEEFLRTSGQVKQTVWSKENTWHDKLRVWFRPMENWRSMMCSLRGQVFAAQESWRKSVEDMFDKHVSLPILETKVREACRREKFVTATEAIISAFHRTDALLSQEELQAVEKGCFIACKRILDDEVKVLKDQEMAEPKAKIKGNGKAKAKAKGKGKGKAKLDP